MPDKANIENNHIQALFTEKSFELKKANVSGLSADEARLYELFSLSKGDFIFELAFSEIDELTAAMAFLKYISQEYVKAVFNNPNFKCDLPRKMRNM